jgi:hypothetical protein
MWLKYEDESSANDAEVVRGGACVGGVRARCS